MSEEPAREVSSTAKAVARTKPTLVTIGKRRVVSSLRWNNDCIADHLLEHRNKWQSMADLSRVAWGQTTLKGKERARQRLSKLAHVLASRGEVLVVEYDGPHNRAKSVKVADFASAEDRQSALVRLEVMKNRRDVSDATYATFVALVQRKIAATAA